MELMNDFRLVDNRMEWMKDAKCSGMGTDAFFSDTGETKKCRQACEFCQDCLVKDECLEFALTNRIQFGVWGGMAWSKRERILIKRKENARMVS